MYKNFTNKLGVPLPYFCKFLLIMRITTVLLIATIMQVSASGLAQNITYRSDKVSLKALFKVIQKQTDYNVVYESETLNASKPIRANFVNTPLAEVLTSSLSGQNLAYTIEKKTIVIRSVTPSFPAKEVGGPALINIRCRVIDTSGKALAGVTVRLKDGSGGAVTNEAGVVVFTQISSKAILVFTYTGYQMRELPAKTDMGTITMVLAHNDLAEVKIVVSNGYQTIPKERSAGSFSTIGPDVLNKRANYNINDYLQGQVPGLRVAAQGNINIRGISTLTGDTYPLIVVDGYPVEYNLEQINPNNIESITVLKDASAASIWGVRAANGVIVITTKRNTTSKKALDINFSSSFTISPKTDLNKLPFANSSDFLEYEKFKVDNYLVFAGGAFPRPALSEGLDAYLNHPATAESLVAPLRNINMFDEFSKLFMQHPTRQQYAFSVSGKGEKTFQRASFSYDDVETNFKKTGNDRFVTDLYQSTDLTSKLKLNLGLNVVLNNGTTNGMSLADLTATAPYQKILGPNGSYIPQPAGIYQADKDALFKSGYPYNWDYNMDQEFNNKDNTSKGTYITADVGLNYKFTKALSFSTGYHFESQNQAFHQFQSDQTYFVRNLVDYSTSSANGALTTGVPLGGILYDLTATALTHIFRNQLKFDGDLGSSDNQLTAIAGLEIQQLGYGSSSLQKYGFDPQTLQYSNVNYNTPYTTISNGQYYIPDYSSFSSVLNRYVSYYTNLGYTYRGKYSINASARQDRTNLFGASDQLKNVWLWSSGVSWQANKESFLENGPFSSLIFRASYGVNGNVDRSTSPQLIANLATDYTSNQPYAYVSNPENPELRWERTAVSNVGIDFVTLKGRLSGTVEYYYRKSTDLLGNSTVNGTYGFNSAFINYASMKNSGIDVHLRAQLLKGDFAITTTVNYSYNNNKVLDVDFPQSTAGSFLAGAPQKGLPLNYLYSYRWAGLSATGTPRVYNEKGQIVDYTTEMSNAAGLVYSGTTTPPHYGGLFTEFAYKNLSLTAGLTYSAGNKFRVPVIQYVNLLYSSTSGGLSNQWSNRWQKPGDENITNIPAMPKVQSDMTLYDQEPKDANINVENAANIRFQEILLNYTLPRRIFSTNIAPVINIGLQVRNVAVFTFNKAKLDPNYLTLDQYNIALAPPPEYTLSIKANF